MRVRTLLPLALGLAGLLSCSNGTSRVFKPNPGPAEDVRITLAASPTVGQPGQPVAIIATLRNAGRVSVLVHDRCPDPIVRIYDGQGLELFQRDPTQAVPCPLLLIAPTLPGEWVEIPITFDGGYYSQDGQHHQVPAGNYKAVALFTYSPFVNNEVQTPPRTLSREVVFTWQ